MPSINMIAPRRAEKRRLERDMRRLVVVILAELVIAVGLGGWVCTRIFTTRAKVADLKVEIQKLQPVVNEIEKNKQETAKLKPKLELLSQARTTTMRWYNTLDRLTASLPQSTWLTRISTVATTNTTGQTTDSGVLVNINGVSINQAKVGEVMMQLGQSPDFDGVDLHFTQKTSGEGANAIEFEIGAKMKSTDQKKEVQQNGARQS